MTHILPLLATAPVRPASRAQAIRSRSSVALACFVAAVVFATVAAASTPLLSWMEGQAGPAAPAPRGELAADAAAPAVFEETARSRGRSACDSCGVVESVRRLEQAAGLPASYEFTVRLRDGSSRTTSIANSAQWRAGDRIMLIGGARPLVK